MILSLFIRTLPYHWITPLDQAEIGMYQRSIKLQSKIVITPMSLLLSIVSFSVLKLSSPLSPCHRDQTKQKHFPFTLFARSIKFLHSEIIDVSGSLYQIISFTFTFFLMSSDYYCYAKSFLPLYLHPSLFTLLPCYLSKTKYHQIMYLLHTCPSLLITENRPRSLFMITIMMK